MKRNERSSIARKISLYGSFIVFLSTSSFKDVFFFSFKCYERQLNQIDANIIYTTYIKLFYAYENY